MNVDQEIQKGYELAKAAQGFAYAPYSRFKVGCALKVIGDKTIYSGCNVENTVFPSGTCAERATIFSLFGKKDPSQIRIEWIMVLTSSSQGEVPCGMCQQVIAEFAPQDLPIYIGNLEGLKACYTLQEMRPLNYCYPHRKDQLSS